MEDLSGNPVFSSPRPSMVHVKPLYSTVDQPALDCTTVGQLKSQLFRRDEIVSGSVPFLEFREGSRVIPLLQCDESTSLESLGVRQSSRITYQYQLHGSAPLDLSSILTLVGGLLLIAIGICFFILQGIFAAVVYYIIRACGWWRSKRDAELEALEAAEEEEEEETS